MNSEFPNLQILAPYACAASLNGRLQPEPDDRGASGLGSRSEFQRDRDRIIHSTAFRRLKHKTQVFVYHEGDYYRTRLTHSLEVAQIARTCARALQLNEDLAEAVALAHDLGHTPFGHAGESALNQAMQPFGGFDHNEQTIRILTRLEERYAAFDGLNLTWETIEGVAKHNGPVSEAERRPSLAELDSSWPLQLSSYASAEAQIANLCDDIAYLAHDVDDSLRAGLFAIERLRGLPVITGILDQLDRDWPGLARQRMSHELTRRLISHFVHDLLVKSSKKLAELAPADVAAIRQAGQPVILHSKSAEADLREIRNFLFDNMWRHYKVNRMTSKAKRVIASLFSQLLAETNLLPHDWQAKLEGLDETAKARVIADYVASMTDRYALLEYDRLFETGPILT